MTATRAKPQPIGPYSRPHVLAKLDRRTREARLLATLREELTAHVGGQPSAVQYAVIERAAWLGLRLAMMDAKAAEAGDMGERDGRQYLAWANSYGRLLRQLGGPAKAGSAERSLADLLAERATAR